MKHRTIIFATLGLGAIVGLTVEAAASTWEGSDHTTRQSIVGQAIPALGPHAHYGVTGTSSPNPFDIPVRPGPWSGQ